MRFGCISYRCRVVCLWIVLSSPVSPDIIDQVQRDIFEFLIWAFCINISQHWGIILLCSEVANSVALSLKIILRSQLTKMTSRIINSMEMLQCVTHLPVQTESDMRKLMFRHLLRTTITTDYIFPDIATRGAGKSPRSRRSKTLIMRILSDRQSTAKTHQQACGVI